MNEPLIEYPCTWSFRIMGEDEEQIKTLVSGIMEEAAYTLELANRTSGGRYLSLNLTTEVASQDHRDTLFRSFSCSPVVKMVL